MAAEAERHYRHRHPWIHDSDDESYAPVIAHTKCPLYYEEKEESKGSCVFCEAKKPSGDVKMTKFLDEMEAKMFARWGGRSGNWEMSMVPNSQHRLHKHENILTPRAFWGNVACEISEC